MKMRVRITEQGMKYKAKILENSSSFPISMRDIQTISNKAQLLDNTSAFPISMRDIQIISQIDVETYDGGYEVKPNFEIQTLPTAHKYMAKNVTVDAIEVSRVSNPYGGSTVYIGGIF